MSVSICDAVVLLEPMYADRAVLQSIGPTTGAISFSSS